MPEMRRVKTCGCGPFAETEESHFVNIWWRKGQERREYWERQPTKWFSERGWWKLQLDFVGQVRSGLMTSREI